MFAPHFTLAEFLAVSDRSADVVEQQRAARLSLLLEVMRQTLGGAPLVVTSWLRNDDAASGHFTGDAVDVRPRRDWSQRQIFDAVTAGMRAAGAVWGELIFYPFSDWHIHLTLYPVGGRNEILIADREERVYSAPTPELLAAIPTAPALLSPAQTGTAGLVAALGTAAVVAIGRALT